MRHLGQSGLAIISLSVPVTKSGQELISMQYGYIRANVTTINNYHLGSKKLPPP
ncbi:MAG: hypothetical protein JWO13_2633 [Acidobacteriales bacterium]|nr:hypothetical protein [Terriglobales bacterium]